MNIGPQSPEEVDAMLPIQRRGDRTTMPNWFWRIITVLLLVLGVGVGYMVWERLGTMIDESRAHRELQDKRLTTLEAQWDFVQRANTAGTIKNAADIADMQNDRKDVMSAINGVRSDLAAMKLEIAKELGDVKRDVAVIKSKMGQ